MGKTQVVATRTLGLDCGPMSGFNNEAVDPEFFAGTRIKSNFICSIGFGSDENLCPRNPRLTFEESGRFAQRCIKNEHWRERRTSCRRFEMTT
jgi:hypothetical protein